MDFHRLWVDAREFVVAELREKRDSVRVHVNSIGQRVCGRHMYELYVARFRHQPANHVRALYREPKISRLIEHRRVRIASLLRQTILSNRACVRVQFADIAGEIASEPDVAFLVGCETVGPRFRGLCPILTESSRSWIEPPEDACHLTRVPNCTVRRGKRVVRMRALCRHRPFCERDVRLRQCPQRSNSGDRQKTKKCGNRRGQNSSPYLKSLHGFLVKMLGGQRLNPTALARRASSLLTVTTRAH